MKDKAQGPCLGVASWGPRMTSFPGQGAPLPPGPLLPGPPAFSSCPSMCVWPVSGTGACSGTPDASLPRDFRRVDARKFSCRAGLTLEPGCRVLRGLPPSLLTLGTPLALL